MKPLMEIGFMPEALSVKPQPYKHEWKPGVAYNQIYTGWAHPPKDYDKADLHKVNLLGSVTWAFEFEDQPFFDGFRDLSTDGLAKPVLNVFRMLGQMGGDRVSSQSSGALPLDAVRETSVRDRPDINALASRQARSIAVLVWNYHDDGRPAPDAAIDLTISGVPAGRVRLTHHRVDRERCNSYEAWKKMGSPQPPSAQQMAALEKVSQLQELEPSRQMTVKNGVATVPFTLPRQSVSLVKITW
jgi:xylan 1,4-beta-xylosidase